MSRARSFTLGGVMLPFGIALLDSPAAASFVAYTDFAAWQGAAGQYTTIGFDEVPDFTFLLDEYSDLGVSFPSPLDYTACCSFEAFPLDGAGLKANWHPVEIIFDSPQSWIGMHHPGILQIKLYDGNALVYQSGILGGSGNEFFSGIVGTTTFTRAMIKDPFNGTFDMDNLYFGGPAIPTPGAVAALLVAALIGRRRRA